MPFDLDLVHTVSDYRCSNKQTDRQFCLWVPYRPTYAFRKKRLFNYYKQTLLQFYLFVWMSKILHEIHSQL